MRASSGIETAGLWEGGGATVTWSAQRSKNEMCTDLLREEDDERTHLVPEIQSILIEPFSMNLSRLMMCVGWP